MGAVSLWEAIEERLADYEHMIGSSRRPKRAKPIASPRKPPPEQPEPARLGLPRGEAITGPFKLEGPEAQRRSDEPDERVVDQIEEETQELIGFGHPPEEARAMAEAKIFDKQIRSDMGSDPPLPPEPASTSEIAQALEDSGLTESAEGVTEVVVWLDQGADLDPAQTLILLRTLARLRQSVASESVHEAMDSIGEAADFYLAHTLETT